VKCLKENLTSDQIERRNKRQRVESMTPEQRERARARQRFENLAPELVEGKREYQRDWFAKNGEKLLLYFREYNRARYANKLNATPPWADRAAIAAVYAEAERLTRETGIPHHVDHIVPLKHPLVCGLHVHTNLRAIPASENLAKGNRLLEECHA